MKTIYFHLKDSAQSTPWRPSLLPRLGATPPQAPPALALALALCLTHCATPRVNDGYSLSDTAPLLTQEGTEKQAQPIDLRKLVSDLSERLQALEAKLSSLNDKWDAHLFTESIAQRAPLAPLPGQTSSRAPASTSAQSSSPPSGSPAPLLLHAGPTPEIASRTFDSGDAKKKNRDAEGAFLQDEAIQLFRKGHIYNQALQHSEAILTFSDFLEKYPDHPLASAAQFQIAEAYRLQKETHLALQEYRKLLNTYDRSAYTSDALKNMASLEESLKQTQESNKHRQLLSSLFASSPAASELERELASPPAPQTPVPEKEKIPTLHTLESPPPTASLEGPP